MIIFCTCGRGTESFAANELKQKFATDKVTYRDGKVFLCLDSHSMSEQNVCNTLLNLRMVERIFVAVLHSPTFSLSSLKQEWKLKTAIQDVKFDHWQQCFEWCTRLRSAALAIRSGKNWHTTLKIDSQGDYCASSKLQTDSTQMNCQKLVDNERDEELVADKPSSTSEPDKVITINSSLFEQNLSGVDKCISPNTGDTVPRPLTSKCVATDCKTVGDGNKSHGFRDNVDERAVDEKLHIPIQSGSFTFFTDCSNNSKNLSINSSQAKKRLADVVVRFRVSAKCSGQAAKYFTSQTLSRHLGCQIAYATGWKTELKKPELEIYAQLNHEGLVIGMPINSVPLSCRPYLLHAGLRTTIASIIVSLANIQPGFTVVDPMCGEATLLIEAAKQNNDLRFIGCDLSAEQCDKAVDNIKYAGECHCIDILRANVAHLPLSTNSVDAVICDMPFGNKHSTVEVMRNLFPALIISINRIIRCGGRIVLLVGAQLKDSFIGVVNDLKQTGCSTVELDDIDGSLVGRSIVQVSSVFWSINLTHYVKLGETDAFIVSITKDSEVPQTIDLP